MSLLPKSDSIQIREVWNDNLEEEFALIRGIVDEFPFIAMDTEFPGIVLRPVGNFKNSNDYHYQTLKDNVDINGTCPRAELISIAFGSSIFVNLMLTRTFLRTISIELLRQSGIDFMKSNEKGIDAVRFGGTTDVFRDLVLYDIKHLMKFCNSLHGGLNKLAELLEMERFGFDSLLSSKS
uniref:Uncharacterized protein n=1 Tax=Vitis vinifera TaxID=29760 RepID=A5C4B8_VITVI|nr:hypothetical protein VITISV_020892 [Vitis vinifera]